MAFMARLEQECLRLRFCGKLNSSCHLTTSPKVGSKIVLYVTVIITGGIASGKATSLNPTDTLFIIQLEEWLVATWAVEVALNSIVTGLIVYRIWSVGRIAAKSNI